jgi:hypothetical protein
MAKYPLTALRTAIAAALVGLCVSSFSAADRRWQTGMWRDSGDERSYVIATSAVRLHLEDVPPREKRAMAVKAGAAVKFAVEGSRAFVLDADGAEHELHLVRSVDLNYTATGAGHFIKAIAQDGLLLTLEDNSVWELDPRSQFFTKDWQPFDGISVRRDDSEQNFDYEIDNSDRDDGALARYSPR